MNKLLASLALSIALVGNAFAQAPAGAPAADKTPAKAAADPAAAKPPAAATAGAATPAAASAKSAGAAKGKEAKAAKPSLLDLNSASEADIAALPGVGADNAKKIIAARPFAKKDQLVSKKVLSKDDYAKVKDLVIAKQPAKK